MTPARSWAAVVAGYTILAVAMLVFLTINGVSDTAVGTIGTAGLILVGLLLPVAGMMALARHVDPRQRAARKGLVLQSLGLIGLLAGLAVSFVAPSLSGHVLSAVLIVASGTSFLVGAIVHSRAVGIRQPVVAAALIAVGAALIPASNIALQSHLILNADKYVYQDIGATAAACGCVLAAYASFVLPTRGVGRLQTGDR